MRGLQMRHSTMLVCTSLPHLTRTLTSAGRARSVDRASHTRRVRPEMVLDCSVSPTPKLQTACAAAGSFSSAYPTGPREHKRPRSSVMLVRHQAAIGEESALNKRLRLRACSCCGVSDAVPGRQEAARDHWQFRPGCGICGLPDVMSFGSGADGLLFVQHWT